MYIPKFEQHATAPAIVVVDPADRDVLDRVRELFREYAAFIGQFHGQGCLEEFQKELDGLPGAYGPPKGRILAARYGDELAGCAALRDSGAAACEIKRVYVRPEYRGRGVGRDLVVSIIEEARRIGYPTIRLDTMKPMTDAQALYRSLGFVNCGPYLPNHPKDALFFELTLQ